MAWPPRFLERPRVARLIAWAKQQPWSRRRSVAAGVVLLGVPTFFTMFPSFTAGHVGERRAIIAIWAVLAGVTVGAQTRREKAMDDLTIETERQRGLIRLATTFEALRTLLHEGTMGMPSGYEFTVYIAEAGGRWLHPIFPKSDLPPGTPDVRSFESGKGATGTAWLRGTTFVVTGEKVHNDHHELTPDQQAYFTAYRTVASTPIEALGGRRIGVLTAISPNEDGHFDEGQAGIPTLERLAEMVGVILKSIPEQRDLRAMSGGTVTPPT